MVDLVDLRGLSLERDGPDGPLRVLDGLDLRVACGQRLALIGGNGSGKSSLLRHLATPGTLPRVKAGLVFQDPDEQLVAATVDAELRLGNDDAAVSAILDEFGLAGRGADDPRLLSAGQKQRLQLALVLGTQPDLLLLDEPTSLQDDAQARWLRAHLDRRDEAVIWATQKRDEVALCHRALVLDRGRALIQGPVAEVLADPRCASLLQPAYPDLDPAPPAPGEDEPVAVAEGLRFDFADGCSLGPVSLDLRAGDRLGITGPNGCGKSTLMAAMAGLRRPDAGSIRLGRRRLYQRGATDLDHGGAALAPQFPEYLFTGADVAAEIALDPVLAGMDPAVFLGELGLTADLARRNPHDLSGGQRRRLALGLALAAGRSLILLDEPTAALDAAGRARVAALVRDADPAAAVVVASHDRDFLAACGCQIRDLA